MRIEPTRTVLILLATALWGWGVGDATGQPTTQSGAAVTSTRPGASATEIGVQAAPQITLEDRRLLRLKSRVEERWRVVRVREGLVLVPRRGGEKLRGIELTGDEILIDGRAATGAEIRERLGGDADAVLGLSYLDESTRHGLFAPVTQSARPTEPPPVAAHDPSQQEELGRFPDRRHGARVRIGSDLTVGENERIDGPAVAILGSVQVDGEVREEVVAVGGSIRLGPKAQVRGDVVSVGGQIEMDPQARVLGATNEVAIAWPQAWDGLSVSPGIHRSPWPGRDWWAGMSFFTTSVRLGLIGLLGAIVVLVGGRTYERVRGQVEATPWQALLIGIGAQLILLPLILLVCVTLLVSVIGIPLLALVPIALVVLGALWLLGFAAVSERIGQRLAGGLGAGDIPPVVGFLIGFVVVTSVAWVCRVAWWGEWIGWATAFALGAVGAIIEGLAWAAGLGGVVLAWLRRDKPEPVTPPPLTVAIDGPATL